MPTALERLEALGYRLRVEDGPSGEIEAGRRRLRLTATKGYVGIVEVDDELDCTPEGRALAVDFGIKGLIEKIENKEAEDENN